MSIIAFHRILIATAILFCGLFAAWEFASYLRDGGWTALALAAGFGVGAAALIYYLAHLNRFLGRKPSA